MINELDLRLSPREAAVMSLLRKAVARKLKIKEKDINDVRIVRRSIDARHGVKVNLTVRVAAGDDMSAGSSPHPVKFTPVSADAPVMVIVGAGPAGLFAALKCIQRGIRPIVLERGHDVDARRLDLAAMCREGRINPASNYCYGEGGAGAFSDGKLFTRSKKRGNVEDVLQLLVQFGASERILVDAHPHIGSDRLPKVIKAIREEIIRCGGEVHFSTRVDSLVLVDGVAEGVVTSDGREYRGAVMLATGHSARDTIRRLHAQGVCMQAKGIAVGVRLEHPQNLIDKLQYHSEEGRGEYLPVAEYSFVTQSDGRGVYSFCMCPGGVIVPAGSADGELVVNGMSASARAGKFANSGMVVEIRPGDFPEYEESGEMQLLDFQENLERSMFEAAGKTINAPAQRMQDFVEGKISESLPDTSYAPGIHPADFNELLPPFIADRLRDGFRQFGVKRPGFLTNEAKLIGLESRTSSPVRIPRDPDSLCHTEISNLYPVGEGAGYAGGIVSAALDGMRAADAYADTIGGKAK